jgi:hypothetical protein
VNSAAFKIRVLRFQPSTRPAAHISGADALRDDAFEQKEIQAALLDHLVGAGE